MSKTIFIKLQQCLPFTVLKPLNVLFSGAIYPLQQCLPFTVLKLNDSFDHPYYLHYVATVLTVYGIETHILSQDVGQPSQPLQQCLPFTVLKP